MKTPSVSNMRFQLETFQIWSRYANHGTKILSVVEMSMKIGVLINVRTRNNRQCATVPERLIWDLPLLCAVQLKKCEFCTWRQWQAYKGIRNLFSTKRDIQDINTIGAFRVLIQFMNRNPESNSNSSLRMFQHVNKTTNKKPEMWGTIY
jgi:hypothetical protein